MRDKVNQSIVGQEAVIERLLIALLTGGNVLMEGLPGLAKTRAIKTLAKHIDSKFSRVQFTPDLLPADLTGTEMYFSKGGKGQFQFQAGPIFGNLILADEINRAPAKVQAALLEAMEEQQVTVAGKTHKLPELFMVLATQNPIEQEGTYPLPEAQMDRFLLHVTIEHPSDENELEILRLVLREEAASGELKKEEPMSQDVVLESRREVQNVDLSEPIEKYMVALIGATRRPNEFGEDLGKWIRVGASPRGTLCSAGPAGPMPGCEVAITSSPTTCVPSPPTAFATASFLSYEATAEGITPDDVIAELLKVVAVG